MDRRGSNFLLIHKLINSQSIFLNGVFMPKIEDIEGIGPVYAKKLMEAGVHTTDDLLKVGATAKGREELGKKTGIEHKLILEWVNLADLYRIKGVGQEYSDLLEEAGVDTVVELAKRVPENLHAKMLEVNEEKNLVNRPPPLSAVKDWVEQAKKLKRVVEY
jgi:predicted flap endonuclease-1-like 5' DNA nuclease